MVLPAPEWSFSIHENDNAAPIISTADFHPTMCSYVSKLQYSNEDISRARRFLQDVVRPFAKGNIGIDTDNTSHTPRPMMYPIDGQTPTMSDDQWGPYSLWMQQSRRRHTNSGGLFSYPQLQMIVSGEGGTGKSWLIKHIIQDQRIVFGREEATKRILLMAHQGSAAYLIGGRTLTSALGLPSQGGVVFDATMFR
jgi:hypothetical protein